MAVDAADGVLGLEAVHNVNGVVDLNTQGGLPRYKIDRITGLHDLPESDDNRTANTGRVGETIYPSQARGKTVVYEGRLIAASLQQLREKGALLRALFSNRSEEYEFTVTPHPSYGLPAWKYWARCLSLTMEESQQYGPTRLPSPWQRPFIVTVRQSDPRYYGAEVSVGAADGAWSSPFVEGTAEASPRFSIPGPIVDDLVIEYDGTYDRRLEFADLAVSSGHTMVVDFKTRRAYNNNTGALLTGYLDFAESDWWDERVPGLYANATNKVRVVGGGGAWTMAYRPASW